MIVYSHREGDFFKIIRYGPLDLTAVKTHKNCPLARVYLRVPHWFHGKMQKDSFALLPGVQCQFPRVWPPGQKSECNGLVQRKERSGCGAAVAKVIDDDAENIFPCRGNRNRHRCRGNRGRWYGRRPEKDGQEKENGQK